MADGTARPIEQVQVGDRVVAHDPRTGISSAQTVATAIAGDGAKILVDIIVDLDGGATSTITATDGHPFWLADEDEWRDALQLRRGDQLLGADGRRVTVKDVVIRTATATVHNLTVTTSHSFFAVVGTRAVLVHNCEPVRVKPGRQAAGPEYAMTRAERRFVQDLHRMKRNLQVYRTHNKMSQGDFLIIDRSNPRSPVGWVVELKSAHGGFPGEQFMNAGALKGKFGLSALEFAAGTPDEMLAVLNRGRREWPT